MFEKKYLAIAPNKMCYMLKNENISCQHFKTQLRSRKKSFFNDFKWRRTVLSRCKKIICIIKKNNIKTFDDFYC